MEEKLSIRNTAQSLKKYGSTSFNQTKRNEVLIKHVVASSDTLQGIALKYGVTTEQIRRANRLWASDSLFLREHLMIPVIVGNPYHCSENMNTQTEEISTPVNIQQATATATSAIAGSLGEKSIDEFLGKIDSSIAVTKKEVKRSQGNSEFLSGTSVRSERRKPAISRMKLAANNNTSSVPDLLTTPQAVVMTQGKKVRTSLQRLEQQQDELFEL